MSTDDRREQLLVAGARLLRSPYEEVSIEEIAEAAGVSKGLLYHYFPTKKDFIVAALERGQGELHELTASRPGAAGRAARRQPRRFLDFVEEHETAFSAIFRSRGGGDPEILAALEAGRRRRIEEVLEMLVEWEAAPAGTERTPELETAVQGWFFFVEGAVLRWLRRTSSGRGCARCWHGVDGVLGRGGGAQK